MVQEPTAIPWDIRTISYEPSLAIRAYILFLLVVCVATSAKLIKLWYAAPPFLLKRRTQNPAYLQQLERARDSLKQWIGVTLLVSGLTLSLGVYHVCDGLLDMKAFGKFLITSIIWQFAEVLTSAFAVVLFTFLVRWYIVKRLERLHQL